MTCRLIEAEKGRHSVARLCRALRVSRSGFYAWRGRPISDRAASDVSLAAKVAAIHAASDGTYGVPRVHAELATQGIATSRRRVARLMREQGLEGVSRRRRRRSTTMPTARPAAPDLVGRRFSAATGPNEVWFADITYVPTWEGWQGSKGAAADEQGGHSSALSLADDCEQDRPSLLPSGSDEDEVSGRLARRDRPRDAFVVRCGREPDLVGDFRFQTEGWPDGTSADRADRRYPRGAAARLVG